MRLFITGISGLLGLNMAMQLQDQFEVSGSYLTHPIHKDGIDTVKMDYASVDSMEQTFTRIQPQVIVHTAGLTNVEACEVDPHAAKKLNVDFAQYIAEEAHSIGAKLVHLSTDHIFDGTSPCKDETATPNPINVYARTKLQAEHVVAEAHPGALMLRTNFYGWGPSYRPSFSDWILQSLQQRQVLTMFTDVFYTPILIHDFIEVLMKLLAIDACGVFHIAGGERLSKYEFGMKLAKVFGYPRDCIQEISVENLDFKALRPKDMSLSCTKVEDLLSIEMPMVEEGLERLRDLGKQDWPEILEGAVQKQSSPPIP